MKMIKIENARANLEGLIEYVNKNKEQVKISSENVEAVIIDVQTWSCWEKLLEDIEDIRLLELAKSRKSSHFTAFADLITEEGFSLDEIKKLTEKVEIE